MSDVHDTFGKIPPPDTLSGNHPEPVVRPWMNSRSEQYTLYRVRAPLTLCLTCVVFVLLLCSVFIVYSPLSLSGSSGDRCRCPCDRLRRRRPYSSYYRASRQAEPLPLSHISPTCLFLSVALGICCCYVAYLLKCIACHCRHLLYLFLYPMQPIIYIIYTSGPCALLVNRIR